MKKVEAERVDAFDERTVVICRDRWIGVARLVGLHQRRAHGRVVGLACVRLIHHRSAGIHDRLARIRLILVSTGGAGVASNKGCGAKRRYDDPRHTTLRPLNHAV
jgi:hypothetical protein